MKKKLAIIAMTLCVIVSMLPVTAQAAESASGTCGKNVTWMLDSNGVLSIKGTGEMTEYESMRDVPWFDYRENIISVNISPGVTSIAPYSFWRDSNLCSISIPEGVKKIGKVCFLDCSKLSKISLPRSLQEIEEMAFDECYNLVSVGSVANVSKIGHHAFSKCSSLLSLDISSKIKEISWYTFMGCVNLTDVGDLSNVTVIGERAFYDCYNLKKINSLEKVIDYRDEAFSGCRSLTTLGKINTNAKVGKDVFHNCPNLAERDILDPESGIHDITSDWRLNNASRIGWINIGECPLNPSHCGRQIVTLVNKLCGGITDDLSKARAIYAWVVDNICYDYDKYSRPGMAAWLITDEDKGKLLEAGGSDNIFDYSKDSIIIILNRGICDDYCYILSMMFRLAGIPAANVECKAGISLASHACVMAFLDGEWRFFDPTFDSSGAYRNETYAYKSSNGSWNYFNMNLDKFSENHFFDKDVGAYEDHVPSSWAQNEVWCAQLKNLVPTELQSNYRRGINREEFCNLMVKLIECESGQNINDYLASRGLEAANPFNDTTSSTVSAAYVLGIVKGISENKFNPYRFITRQEAAVMLSRTAKVLGVKTQSTGKSFSDAKYFAPWAADHILFVSGLIDPTSSTAVMSGVGDNIFSPNSTYTREQAIMTSLRIFNCAS